MKKGSSEASDIPSGLIEPEEWLLHCLPSFSDFLWLHTGSNRGPGPWRHTSLAGAGILAEITLSSEEQLPLLDSFIGQNKGKWIFSHLSYEARHLLESGLPEAAVRYDEFSPISFFVPRFVIKPSDIQPVVLDQQTNESLRYDEWQHSFCKSPSATGNDPHLHETPFVILDEYRKKIDRIFNHLHRGDIYEMNYCLPFLAKGNIDRPELIWNQLQREQQAPFAALYRRSDQWLLSASPERWITNSNGRLISQPIKGTARRDPDAETDSQIRTALKESEKERAENVMIVDLVRNDLGRVAETGSVKVDELFGIYSFPAVHQMISTISGNLDRKVPFSEVLRAAFPMGSMTGAPKISAMKIISETEEFSRGLYSGSVGYIDPQGDYDFNVVIRSILYNETTQTALFPAGSAITVHCDPEAEYKECLLKSNSMRKALGLPLQC